MADHINFDGHGFNREYVSLDKKVVANVEGYAQALLELTPKTSAALRKAKDKWDDAKKKAKDLKEETRRALINLRTTKEVEKSLPIAIPFLKANQPTYAVPAVNLTSLKNRLEKLQTK